MTIKVVGGIVVNCEYAQLNIVHDYHVWRLSDFTDVHVQFKICMTFSSLLPAMVRLEIWKRIVGHFLS